MENRMEKQHKETFFKTNVTFSSFFDLLFLDMWKINSIFRILSLLYSIYVFNFYQDNFWMLQFTDRFSSLNHQAYWKKKTWSKYYLTISNFLKKLVWLLSFWTEYGKTYQLFFFPKSKLDIYLWNLRWRNNRFQSLRRCCRGILNFPALKIWEIDFLGTCYTQIGFHTCSI